MARKLRIEYAGAAYHVMAQGNQRQAIYAGEREIHDKALKIELPSS